MSSNKIPAEISAAAAALGRIGGKKGGPTAWRRKSAVERHRWVSNGGRARMAKLSAEERKQLSAKALAAKRAKRDAARAAGQVLSYRELCAKAGVMPRRRRRK